MYIIGVDAGGTKTAFMLCNMQGQVLAQYESLGAGFFHLGAQGVQDRVHEGISALLKLAGLTYEDIACAGFGFPGYGEGDNSEAELLAACEAVVGQGRAVCECDCHIAWAGSLGMEPGINVISGTGANCYGVNAEGRSARASGWGAFCDEGSCRWLGEALINTYTKQADGRLPRTPLYYMFRAHLDIDEDLHFIKRLNHEFARDSAKTAALQRHLKSIYEAGDPYAQGLYERAAEELWMAVRVVADQLGMTGSNYRVSYSGGLFQSGECILQPLRYLASTEGVQLTPPRYTPVEGAAIMALRHLQPDFSLDDFSFFTGSQGP